MGLYTRKRARRSLLDTVTFRALSQIATMLGYVVMVRGMSEHDFGVFNLLYAFIPVVSTISSFGLEQTLRRYQPEYLSSGNNAGAAWLVRFVGSARFAINIVVIAIVLLAWNLIAPLFKLAPYRVDFVIFCVLMLLFFQSRVLQITLAAHMLHRFSVGSTLVTSLAKLAAYAALFWMDRFTLRNAIYAEIAATALTYVNLKWAHYRYCRLQDPLQEQRPASEDRKRMLRYAFFNQFNDAGTFLLSTRGDNLFIAALMNPIAVGTYSFYVRLNQMVNHILPMNLFENVIQPLFFAIPAGEAEQRLPRYFSLLLNTNLLLLLPVGGLRHCLPRGHRDGGFRREVRGKLMAAAADRPFHHRQHHRHTGNAGRPVCGKGIHHPVEQDLRDLQRSCSPRPDSIHRSVWRGNCSWNCAIDEEPVHLVVRSQEQLDGRTLEPWSWPVFWSGAAFWGPAMGSRSRSICRRFSTWRLASSFAQRGGSSMSAAPCCRDPTGTFWPTYCADVKRAFCNGSVCSLSDSVQNNEIGVLIRPEKNVTIAGHFQRQVSAIPRRCLCALWRGARCSWLRDRLDTSGRRRVSARSSSVDGAAARSG